MRYVTYIRSELGELATPTIDLDHVVALWWGGVGVGCWGGFDVGTGLALGGWERIFSFSSYCGGLGGGFELLGVFSPRTDQKLVRAHLAIPTAPDEIRFAARAGLFVGVLWAELESG